MLFFLPKMLDDVDAGVPMIDDVTDATALSVLKGIEDMLGTEVKYFSMVQQDGERMYICLGKRALFLIDFEPPFQEQFYYAWIQRVIIDTDPGVDDALAILPAFGAGRALAGDAAARLRAG